MAGCVKDDHISEIYELIWYFSRFALSADKIAVRLDITEKWKTFEELWNRRNMYRDYYKAFNQKGTIIDVSG